MAFDWSGYLVLANTLLAGSKEAEWRSAISRAYYAAFNQAKRLASGGIRTSEGSHDKVWNEIERSAERRWVGIAKNGQRLKYARVRADYKAHVTVTRQEALAALQTAEALLRQLHELRQASS